ncbi:MAG: hypothetical protein JSS20_02690 [Proteobacteria bacterium]|nr:hypothetical protein [Pseudomonadota bacterium]
MDHSKPNLEERLALVRATGVPVSSADEERISDAIAASLKALASAAPGSLFDTEPQTFDIVMKALADEGRHD